MKESHERLSRESVTFRAAMAGKLAPALVQEMRDRVEASRVQALDRLTGLTAAAGSGVSGPGIIAESLRRLATAFETLDAWRDVLAAYGPDGRLDQGGQETPPEGDKPA